MLTTAKHFERGAVVVLDTLLARLDEQPNSCGRRVELVDLQALHHLPVTTWEGEGGRERGREGGRE